ncbi:hypothetical protein P171DRAFT_371553 [Karstenula rhodostoma CBS 690.94]|uniref:Uncharacterized protein n=1 Tax=Karstenula rhodostoma CBS 690.94 TaxID=1392251 RepID=A0A9P4U6S2_9PLEO|nr:hypothetical protein P171DRAFT_371553 [Karstenula rhodostoma CBS 690.94]
MPNLDSFLWGQFHLPEDVIVPSGANLTPYYCDWGFTVYRTAYGPSSDEHWHALLEDIRADVLEQLTGPDGTCQAEPVAQHILSLFHLDVRSDPAVLNYLKMDALRKVCKDEVAGRPMIANQRERNYFLLVDKGVVYSHGNRPNTPRYKP